MLWYEPRICIWIAGYIMGYSWNDAILSHCMQFLIISLEFKFWKSFSLKTFFSQLCPNLAQARQRTLLCPFLQNMSHIKWLISPKFVSVLSLKGQARKLSMSHTVWPEVDFKQKSSSTGSLLQFVSGVWPDVQLDRKSIGHFLVSIHTHWFRWVF